MEIIKHAFIEGRETDVDWINSEAKRNQIKATVAIENFSTMSEKEFKAVIPLQQICPSTGAVLNTFTSRLAAAKYICTEILKRPDKNPVAITGNMEMCIRAGWKSYGYYWKIITKESMMESFAPTGTKVPHRALAPVFDGYYLYIKHIVTNKLYEDNPFFPRVYKCDTITDDNGRIKYRIELESLHAIDTAVEPEALFNIAENLFNADDLKYATNDEANSIDYMRTAELQKYVLCGLIRDCIRGKIKSLDDNLNKACAVIADIKKESNRELNMHYGNIMFRMSPHLQIVITDPLS